MAATALPPKAAAVFSNRVSRCSRDHPPSLVEIEEETMASIQIRIPIQAMLSTVVKVLICSVWAKLLIDGDPKSK